MEEKKSRPTRARFIFKSRANLNRAKQCTENNGVLVGSKLARVLQQVRWKEGHKTRTQRIKHEFIKARDRGISLLPNHKRREDTAHTVALVEVVDYGRRDMCRDHPNHLERPQR